ncbi:MAG: hypothetical protein ACREH4_15945 [Vitreimonas sp.]
MAWGASEWVAVVSAVLALASLVLNWAVVRRQTQLQFESLKAQMDAEVLDWAHEAINLVSQAEALARGCGVTYAPEEFRRAAHETAQSLSAAADRGRLFFPNLTPHAHGQHKEAAFQGFRQPILDAVIFSCAQLEHMIPKASEPDEAAAAFLNKCRRLLVSEAQNAVDPRRREQMLRRLVLGRMDDKKSAFAVAAELGEAMEARYPGYLVQRRDAKWVAEREAISRVQGRSVG